MATIFKLLGVTTSDCIDQEREQKWPGFATTLELIPGKNSIGRAVQKETFQEVREHLTKGKPIPSRCPTYSLEPKLNNTDQIIFGGWLRNAQVGARAREPLLLPNKHPVTELIVRHSHRVIDGHMEREQTTAAVREKF